eukprot:GILK01004131.1.p1 GENE.GILK01004131.1~~GILK01004131.1.p1  ORF type:complete len:229 (-),score=38.98 GILK01004131.1:261-947(-)
MAALVQDNENLFHDTPNVVILKSSGSLLLLTKLRDVETQGVDFVFYANRLLRLLVEEALGHLPSAPKVVSTPTGVSYHGRELLSKKLCAVSILRAGDSMIQEVRTCLPGIPVGKILIQRDEEDPEKKPKMMYAKLPQDLSERVILLVDPMLATGGSAKMAISELVRSGVPEEHILFINLITCPEGIRALLKDFPHIKIVTAAVDPSLNDNKYIVPGLGDFGDRYFGTQ